MERVGTRAAVSVFIINVVGIALGQGFAIPFVSLAGRFRGDVMGPGEHRQVKGVGTRAARIVDIVHIVGIALCQGFAAPLIALTGRLRGDVMGAVKYRQMKRHEAVAALGRLESTGRR